MHACERVQYNSEKNKSTAILTRILHVVFFLGKRGLAFRGSSHPIDDAQNGNFLGLIELSSKYDAILLEHVEKVRNSQACGRRLQAHYLSHDAQNGFINACGEEVTKKTVSMQCHNVEILRLNSRCNTGCIT